MTSLYSRILDSLKRERDRRRQCSLVRAGPAFQVLLFHSLYDDTVSSTCPDGIDKSLASSLSFVEKTLRESLAAGFKFIHPDEINRVHPRGRFALLTFDDGYANNLLILPLLRRLEIPALLFVTTDTLLRRRSYWWDVLAREALASGMSPSALSTVRRDLKKLTPQQIEAHLQENFGEQCFTIRGDHDRPLTEEELAGLSRENVMCIGNHTHRHPLLPQIPVETALQDLEECQQHLGNIIGKRPTTMAYPNGRWNPEVVAAAQSVGIKVAFTAERAVSPVPIQNMMTIPRLQPAA